LISLFFSSPVVDGDKVLAVVRTRVNLAAIWDVVEGDLGAVGEIARVDLGRGTDLRGHAPVHLLLSGLISHAEADRPMHVNDVLQLAGFWGDLLSR